jgi:hypothetical protein
VQSALIMKIFLITTTILICLLIAFQIYTTMATKKTETQAYQVIKVEDEFEIRYYPAVTMAMITSSARTYKQLGRSGFTKLAGYIFGGNKDKKQIAMTSPVHMDINDSTSSMSFVMPSSYHKDNLPQPNNSDVTIENISEEYVAAITFGGFATSDNIKKHTTMLEDALKNTNYPIMETFDF